jgi:hypothetical protein
VLLLYVSKMFWSNHKSWHIFLAYFQNVIMENCECIFFVTFVGFFVTFLGFFVTFVGFFVAFVP